MYVFRQPTDHRRRRSLFRCHCAMIIFHTYVYKIKNYRQLRVKRNNGNKHLRQSSLEISVVSQCQPWNNVCLLWVAVVRWQSLCGKTERLKNLLDPICKSWIPSRKHSNDLDNSKMIMSKMTNHKTYTVLELSLIIKLTQHCLDHIFFRRCISFC